MAVAIIPPALTCLRDANSAVQDKISALKQLKNEIIGHDQRKEEVIRQGLVPILIDGLQVSEQELEQRSDLYSEPPAEVDADPTLGARSDTWTHQDEYRLQCYFVSASLARGGLPFVTPLLAGGILGPLFQSLSRQETPQKVALEALRTTHLIVEALWSDIRLEKSKNVRNLQEGLYTDPVLHNLAGILKRRDNAPMPTEQIGLILQIMSTSLDQPRHQDAVIDAGILDELAAKLATHMMTATDVPVAQHPEHLPPSLPDRFLPTLLDALTAIVWGSLYRSSSLLYSGVVVGDDQVVQPEEQMYGGSMPISALASDPSDLLLPRLQAVHSKSEISSSRAFPALGSLTSGVEQASLNSGPPVSSRIISTNDFGSPVLAWLVHLARTTDQAKRLSALWLLVSLMHMSDSSSIDGWRETGNRNRTCAFLIVPLLVRIIQESTASDTGKGGKYPDNKFSRDVREKAPRALAMLIEDHKDLQKAAHDAGAIKLLGQILKKTFDYGTSPRRSMWTATTTTIDDEMEDIADSAATKLGSRTLPAEQVHIFRLRAAVLEALAAITQREDQYRKLVLDQGVMQSIVDSLTPWPDGPTEIKAEMDPEGNPPFVIIQACKVATSLSRSVSMLRTSLIDGGIAKPVFNLLKHPSKGVRQYGTNVITNLVLHFSPMREELIQLGLMKVLCDHIRTPDVELAISSMWALKHLVNASPNTTKIESLNGIGIDFLTQILVGGTPNHTISSTLQGATMAAANAVGEQVDILNTEDSHMTLGESEMFDDAISEDEPMLLEYAGPVLQVQGLFGLKERRAQLKTIREVETSTVLRSQRDDVRMQEQALDYVRNLIGEPGPQQKEMIDHLFAQFGTARLFEILASKFQSKSSVSSASTSTNNGAQFSRTESNTWSSAPVQPQSSPFRLAAVAASAQNMQAARTSTPAMSLQDQMIEYIPPEVIISTLFILIHIANGRPIHRSTLIAQSNLLNAILPLFSHPDNRVRVACCWLIHNLTWQDDNNDVVSAKQRALELRSKGVEEAVRRLTMDSDVDTRDRAKSVVEVFKRLLGENPSGFGDVSEVGQQNLGGAVITGGSRGPTATATAATPASISSARAWER